MFEHMTHGPFILASYVVAFGVFTYVGLASWRRAKKLEEQAEVLKAQVPSRRRKKRS
ncbi:MAG: hypothetical protein PVF65_07665 [Sphingomonadales bacterium]|jgi:hypothetical protein